MPEGTEILAGHDGTVTLAGNASGYGLCVAIEGEAYEGHTLTTKYGHCSQILVTSGQEVVWAVGLRIGENYKVTEDTQKIIELNFNRRKQS